MRLNEVAGLRFDPVTFVVGERVSMVPYARALGISDPVFHSVHAAREAGFTARPVVPALLGFHLTVGETDLTERLGFTWGKTLNMEIAIEWSGDPITEEDTITGSSTVESCWERPGRDGRCRQFLRLRTDFLLGDRATCRWRVLFTEKKDGEPDPRVPREEQVDDPGQIIFPEPDPGSSATASSAELPGHEAELPGHETPVVDRLALARLSVAFDNPDPLHLDDSVARAAGFDQVIGHGAAVLGLLHEPVRRWAGLTAPIRLVARQRAPFTLGATLAASGHRQPAEVGSPRCTTAVRVGDAVIATAEGQVTNRRSE